MSKVEGAKGDPYFNRVTPSEGGKYLEAMVLYCLIHHPDIVPWLGGSIHPDLLEFPLGHLQKGNLARRGGTYQDTAGLLAVVDQTHAQYKAVIFAEVSSDPEGGPWTDAKVMEAVFPKSMAKARADNRVKLLSQAQAFIGKHR